METTMNHHVGAGINQQLQGPCLPQTVTCKCMRQLVACLRRSDSFGERFILLTVLPASKLRAANAVQAHGWHGFVLTECLMSIQLFLLFMRLLGGKASLVNTTHGWTGFLCKYCSATAKEGWQSRTGQARAVLLCYAKSRSQIQFNDRIRRLQPAPLSTRPPR